ncbi:MAG: hypothetical protein AB7F43_09110 [Bacteriovoracia bacterium]
MRTFFIFALLIGTSLLAAYSQPNFCLDLLTTRFVSLPNEVEQRKSEFWLNHSQDRIDPGSTIYAPGLVRRLLQKFNSGLQPIFFIVDKPNTIKQALLFARAGSPTALSEHQRSQQKALQTNEARIAEEKELTDATWAVQNYLLNKYLTYVEDINEEIEKEATLLAQIEALQLQDEVDIPFSQILLPVIKQGSLQFISFGTIKNKFELKTKVATLRRELSDLKGGWIGRSSIVKRMDDQAEIRGRLEVFRDRLLYYLSNEKYPAKLQAAALETINEVLTDHSLSPDKRRFKRLLRRIFYAELKGVTFASEPAKRLSNLENVFNNEELKDLKGYLPQNIVRLAKLTAIATVVSIAFGIGKRYVMGGEINFSVRELITPQSETYREIALKPEKDNVQEKALDEYFRTRYPLEYRRTMMYPEHAPFDPSNGDLYEQLLEDLFIFSNARLDANNELERQTKFRGRISEILRLIIAEREQVEKFSQDSGIKLSEDEIKQQVIKNIIHRH